MPPLKAIHLRGWLQLWNRCTTWSSSRWKIELFPLFFPHFRSFPLFPNQATLWKAINHTFLRKKPGEPRFVHHFQILLFSRSYVDWKTISPISRDYLLSSSCAHMAAACWWSSYCCWCKCSALVQHCFWINCLSDKEKNRFCFAMLKNLIFIGSFVQFRVSASPRLSALE